MKPILQFLRSFRARPTIILRAAVTPEAQLNAALLSLRGPALDALDELLSQAILDQWNAAGTGGDARQQDQAVAGAQVLMDFKAQLQRRLRAAETVRRAAEVKSARP